MIPYGTLMSVPPKDDPCRGIVYPEGYFVLRPGMVPVISWPTSGECHRYAWERIYRPSQKVFNFFLDGSMPFYQEEWEEILQFYEPAGAYKIPKVWYISIMHFGLLGDRMKRLYAMERRYPEDKIFNKMQIVGTYGKWAQEPETENCYYSLDKEGWPHRYVKTVPVASQHLAVGMWIPSWCRVRIMQQIRKLLDGGIRPEEIVYLDTDAIYLARQADDLFDIDPETPGKWKIEAADCEMHVIAPKNYQIRTPDGRIKTVSSSLPAEIKRTMKWGDLQSNKSYEYYEMARDPVTWIKAPKPRRFAAATSWYEDDTETNMYDVPDRYIEVNRDYL